MSETLKINCKLSDTTLEVSLIGQIDEDTNLDEIKGQDFSSLNIDFQNVSMINSCGVREWINFIDSLEESISITYFNCPQIVIEQINMVHGFVKKGTKVDSFYAPYYNESTDEVELVLLKTSDIVDGKAPVKESSSGEELEFDAIEAQYFQFIKQME